ncbi:hypothetical protein [Rothia sp. HMSC075F09]|uniref:hypothetical protein n=1 Tax=Rothia sp. HMSC075F09 TaxID=1739253 RepID=UPI0008A1E54F|nr:hypothetical protein [Rothia sp. HMSC075F09]OFL78110.1 hypothetical protein HMPREF2749_00035 [Rothia sp. HMSC075F09]
MTNNANPLISDYMSELAYPHSKIIDFYERNSRAERFGYIDETYSPPKITPQGIHEGFYVTTCVVFEAEDIKKLRDLTGLYGEFYHANQEHQRNYDLLRTLKPYLKDSSSIIAVNSTVAASEDTKEQHQLVRNARDECLTVTFKKAQDRDDPVRHFIIERLKNPASHIDDNKADRQLVGRLMSQGVIGHVELGQFSPGAEHLLRAPDVVSYPVGRVMRSSDDRLFREISDVVTVYDAHTTQPLNLRGRVQHGVPLSIDPASIRQPVTDMSDETLQRVAGGAHVREEIISGYQELNLRPLPPLDGNNSASLHAVQQQSWQHPMSLEHGEDLTIARDSKTPRQSEAHRELQSRRERLQQLQGRQEQTQQKMSETPKAEVPKPKPGPKPTPPQQKRHTPTPQPKPKPGPRL